MNGLKADLAEVEGIRAAIVAGAAGEAEILVCPPTTLIAAAAGSSGCEYGSDVFTSAPPLESAGCVGDLWITT